MRIYLDHNATTPVSALARAAVAEALALPGNPSSIHAEGRAARDLVERARRQVAALLSASADEVVFTSGGTEANHLALLGAHRRVVASAVEHPSVLGVAQQTVPVDGAGRIDLEALDRVLAAGAPAVIAVALANHELGTVQDLAAVRRVAAGRGALVHCDAVQA